MNNENLRILTFPAFKNKSAAPYNWLLYTNMENAKAMVFELSLHNLLFQRVDVLHLHWPEWYLGLPNVFSAFSKMTALFLCMLWLKNRGTKVVWTAHNVTPHERHHPVLEKVFWFFFLRLVDGYISLSYAAQSILLQAHPYLRRVKSFVIPLGHYRGFYENSCTRHDARTKLGLPEAAKVLLFLGSIRPYKNVPGLIKSFTQIGDPNIHLVIAGLPLNEAVSSELRVAASGNSMVHLCQRFIPDNELQEFFNAADLVVLPFRSILNSASALLALSFDKPILVPAMGSLQELQETVGKAWVQTYSGSLEATMLQDACRTTDDSASDEPPNLDAYNWRNIADLTLIAFREIVYC